MIRPNESNSDSEMSHFAEVVTLKKICPLFYNHPFSHDCVGKMPFGPLSYLEVVIP